MAIRFFIFNNEVTEYLYKEILFFKIDTFLYSV